MRVSTNPRVTFPMICLPSKIQTRILKREFLVCRFPEIYRNLHNVFLNASNLCNMQNYNSAVGRFCFTSLFKVLTVHSKFR